jgi:hypothetical protein
VREVLTGSTGGLGCWLCTQGPGQGCAVANYLGSALQQLTRRQNQVWSEKLNSSTSDGFNTGWKLNQRKWMVERSLFARSA